MHLDTRRSPVRVQPRRRVNARPVSAAGCTPPEPTAAPARRDRSERKSPLVGRALLIIAAVIALAAAVLLPYLLTAL